MGRRGRKQIGPDCLDPAGTGALYRMGVDLGRDDGRRAAKKPGRDVTAPGPALEHPVGLADLPERRPEEEK